jgi:hypothetical protein
MKKKPSTKTAFGRKSLARRQIHLTLTAAERALRNKYVVGRKVVQCVRILDQNARLDDVLYKNLSETPLLVDSSSRFLCHVCNRVEEHSYESLKSCTQDFVHRTVFICEKCR